MIQYRTAAFWRATLALSLGSFIIFSNLNASQPLLPLLRTAFGVSPLQASLSLSAATMGLGVSLLFYGPLSDALGRRWLMVGTMALATLCTLAVAFAPDFRTLLILRAVQGFLLGGLPVIALAYMADEFDPLALSQAVGIYVGANSLGGVFGRLVSGVVAARWGWHSSFLVLAAFSVGCLAVFVWALPRSRRFVARPLRPLSMVRDLGMHLRNPILMAACLIGGLNFFIFINQYNFVTFVLSGVPYHLSADWLGLLFLTYLTGTAAAMFSGRLVGRRSQPLAMALGIALLMLGTLVTLIPRLDAIVIGLFINASGFFFCHSQAASWVNRHALQARGSANALYLLSYYSGASTGSFYLNVFWRWGHWRGVVIGSLLVLSVTISLAFWLRAQERRHADSLVSSLTAEGLTRMSHGASAMSSTRRTDTPAR